MSSSNQLPDLADEDPWPPFATRPRRWVAALDRRIERLDHRYQTHFLSITNALEVQFEQGAVPAAVRLLIDALLATAKAARVAPCAFGLDDDSGRIYASIVPKQRPRGTR